MMDIATLPAPIRYRLDPWEPIRDQIVITIDEVETEGDPEKPFPAKPHVLQTIREWEASNILLIHKSRRMMATWTFAWIYLWMICTQKGRLVAFQSVEEHRADEIIEKAWFIFQRLPASFWGNSKPKAIRRHNRPPRLEIPELNSRIIGLAQGEDKARAHTLSALFMDEVAMWDKFGESYRAARPCAEGGGKVTIVSTGQLGDFHRIVSRGSL